jgi:hypothetical protein
LRGTSCSSTPHSSADTPEVCENILYNVRLNAELQPPPPAAPPACDAAAACSLSGDVYRASYGSITVLPLTWGGADLPQHLHVPHPALLPTHVTAFTLCRRRRMSSSPATACSKSRSSRPSSRL